MNKSLPLTTSHFPTLIERNAWYVDKTKFIPLLETQNSPAIFFLRPRRFGKSLFLSVLDHYYGKQYSQDFDILFGNLFVGKPENITPLRNTFLILKFDFSGIDTGDKALVRESFNAKIKIGFNDFNSHYNFLTKEEMDEINQSESPAVRIGNFLSEVQNRLKGNKIYLLIDEYDHFANELFSFNREYFKDIVSGNGWVRKFYEVIKQFMGTGLIDRFFATGVTPVTLDSMTSGFNIAKNISLSEEFHELSGFTEKEIREMILSTLYKQGAFDSESLIADMRDWYNGNRFSLRATDKLYNPQLVITFLSSFAKEFRYPDEMTDQNVSSDFKKIASILSPLPQEISDEIVEEVLVTEKISESLTLQYNFEKEFSKADAVSLLFYNGLLTIDDNFAGLITFKIPNYVVKQLYWEFFRDIRISSKDFLFNSGEVGTALKEMSINGNIYRLVEFVQKVISSTSFRDLQNFSEKHIKMIFLSLLAGNNAYFISSELETSTGYADLFLKRTHNNPGNWDHLIELKYVKSTNQKKIQSISEKGKTQVLDYRSSLQGVDFTQLRTWLLIFIGKNEFEIVEVG